jgi:hypothetical protein
MGVTSGVKFDEGKDPLVTIPWRIWGPWSLERSIAQWVQLRQPSQILEGIVDELLSMVVLPEVKRVMIDGAKKYGVCNWCGTMSVLRLASAALRHAQGGYVGIDAESGQRHYAHVLANLYMILHQLDRGNDDRP